jgi:hypothetical protein
MTKAISKEAQQIVDQNLKTIDDEVENESEVSEFDNRDLINGEDNNYFLSKIQSTGYNKQDQKELQKVLKMEKDIRFKLGLETMDLQGKVKTFFTHYFGKEDNYYPKMKEMLDIELKYMEGKSKDLILIKNNMNDFGQSLDTYFFNVIDEIEDAHDKSTGAQDERIGYHKQIGILNEAIDNCGKNFNHDYFNLIRTRKKLTSKLGKSTEVFAVNGYRGVLRMKEIENLNSITDLVSALNIGTSLTMEFSRVLQEHVKHTAPLYDLIPNMARKERVIEESQHKLANYIVKYKSVLALLYQHKVNKLGNLVGVEKANEYLGYDTRSNIEQLKK